MRQIQGKLVFLRVSGEFELPRVRVFGVQLYILRLMQCGHKVYVSHLGFSYSCSLRLSQQIIEKLKYDSDVSSWRIHHFTNANFATSSHYSVKFGLIESAKISLPLKGIALVKWCIWQKSKVMVNTHNT